MVLEKTIFDGGGFRTVTDLPVRYIGIFLLFLIAKVGNELAPLGILAVSPLGVPYTVIPTAIIWVKVTWAHHRLMRVIHSQILEETRVFL